ncbi:hypothetical protein QDR00_03900 [Serratia ureilytica]|uniref:hypothetical protein n=1 Tax=Serratia ureilytica TaxID=300181 RepID=UPI003350D9E3
MKKFKFLQLDERKLSVQWMFWLSMLTPIISSMILSIPIWMQTKINISAEGYDSFLNLFKLPIGVLSLSIPLVAIVAHIHRTIQTAEQIQTTRNKNTADSFFSHNKYMIEALTKIPGEDIKIGEGRVKYKINDPYQLYDNLFKGSSYETGIVTSELPKVIIEIENSLNGIAESIQAAKTKDYIKINDIELLIVISKCIESIEKTLTLKVNDNERNKMVMDIMLNRTAILITEFHHEIELKIKILAIVNLIKKILQITNNHFKTPDIINSYIRNTESKDDLFWRSFDEMIYVNRKVTYLSETEPSKKLEKEYEIYRSTLINARNNKKKLESLFKRKR